MNQIQWGALNLIFFVIMIVGWTYDYHGIIHLAGTLGVWITSIMVVIKN